MPESKKLSELIEEFCMYYQEYSTIINHPKIYPILKKDSQVENYKNDLRKIVRNIQNKIDQKFEELRIKISMTDPLPFFAQIENRLKQLEELKCECGKEEIIKTIPKERIHYCSR